MDNLTHALTGAVIAKAGAERATPLATATLVVAANAPDVDMASYLGGAYYALSFRRGITHGWPAMIVLPLLVTAAILAWDRWVRRRRDAGAASARAGPVLALAAVGVATHPTLDWMNTYGMRWGLPFDGGWSYGDALFIIDPWIWLALGGAVFLASDPSRGWLALWLGLAAVASALVLWGVPAARLPWTLGVAAVVALRLSGRPATSTGMRRTARLSAAAVVLYVIALTLADEAARGHVVATAEGAGLTVRDVMVAPVRGNPFASEVEVVTPDSYVPGAYDWLGEVRVELFPERAVPLLQAPADMGPGAVQDVLARARADPQVRDYLAWSRYPYARVERDGTGWRVRYADARYDAVPEAGSLAGVGVRVPASP
ncbi:MAG TPA: metal-dependent hydrolase [Longimicrobiales bacterium]|nr:metal-dependent hydrolase [Longimicrobiales bacterium]